MLTEGLFADPSRVRRCWWCQGHDDYVAYHDDEWGIPVDCDRRLFEKVCLEGFQSGLSWLTILRKREHFRAAFRQFDFHQVARFQSADIERLMQDAGIVRNRRKIEATIHNAARAVEMQREYGSLAVWFWRFEPDDLPPLESFEEARQRTTCPQAVELSRALKQRGWKFVGPTTAYAFMQAMGMVNDHLTGCSRYEVVENLRQAFFRPR